MNEKDLYFIQKATQAEKCLEKIFHQDYSQRCTWFGSLQEMSWKLGKDVALQECQVEMAWLKKLGVQVPMATHCVLWDPEECAESSGILNICTGPSAPGLNHISHRRFTTNLRRKRALSAGTDGPSNTVPFLLNVEISESQALANRRRACHHSPPSPPIDNNHAPCCRCHYNHPPPSLPRTITNTSPPNRDHHMHRPCREISTSHPDACPLLTALPVTTTMATHLRDRTYHDHQAMQPPKKRQWEWTGCY